MSKPLTPLTPEPEFYEDHICSCVCHPAGHASCMMCAEYGADPFAEFQAKPRPLSRFTVGLEITRVTPAKPLYLKDYPKECDLLQKLIDAHANGHENMVTLVVRELERLNKEVM